MIRESGGGGYEIDLDGERYTAASTSDLLTAVQNRVETTLAEHSPTHVFVHAGVVALGEDLVVLPGSSYAGKSTAVAALVRAGAEYWSDEFAPVGADGHVVPFPRPLNRRVETGVERISFRPPVPAAPRAVERVVFARYAPGARWDPVTLTRGEALLRLIEHTVPARQRPAEAMDALDRLLGGARVEVGVRGDADEFAEAISARV